MGKQMVLPRVGRPGAQLEGALVEWCQEPIEGEPIEAPPAGDSCA